MTITFKLWTMIVLMAMASCNNNLDNGKSTLTDSTEECKPYFHFDQVEHYFLDIEEDKIYAVEEKENKTKKETQQLELLMQDTPGNLSDTLLFKDLENLDFVKTEIQTDKFELLNSVFCERKHKEVYALACVAIYRDLLLFKSNNKIIGTAKICFECDQNVIIGTTLNTSEFGQSGDYGKLYKILHYR